MSQVYSDPTRADDPHALPNIETFVSTYGHCRQCGMLVLGIAGYQHSQWQSCPDCSDHSVACGKGIVVILNKTGWFYWFCFPGCIPDSDAIGPFSTEAEAIADAQSDD